MLSIEREAMEAAKQAHKSAERDDLPTEHALLRNMLRSLLGGHGPT